MHNEHNHIDDLLARYFSGEASAHEGVEVGTWLAESEANRQYFAQYQKLWEASKQENTFEPDVEAAWNKVKLQTIHKPVLTINKGQGTGERRFFNQLKIAASIILVTAIGLAAYRVLREPNAKNITLTATTHTINAVLPDSSRIMLSPKSKLLYPETFKKNTREVTLLGEAFFDIAKAPEKPFIIHAGKTSIKVLGTSFTINTITDSLTEVIVKTGVIEFSTPSGIQVLHKGEMAVYHERQGSVEKKTVRTDNLLSKQTGILSFNHTRLADAIADVNAYYGAKVILADPQTGNCTITTDFDHQTLESTLTIIATTMGLRIEQQQDSIILSGTGCN